MNENSYSYVNYQGLQDVNKSQIEKVVDLINSHEYVINLKEEFKQFNLHLSIGQIEGLLNIVLLDRENTNQSGEIEPKMYKKEFESTVTIDEVISYLKELNNTHNKKDL